MSKADKGKNPIVASFTEDSGWMKNPTTNQWVPTHQTHSHADLRWATIQVASGGTPTITTSITGPVRYELNKQSINGRIQRIFLHLTLTIASDVVAVCLPRALKNLEYRIGAKSLGTWQPTAIFVEETLGANLDLDALTFLSPSLGLSATDANGLSLAVGVHELYVDVSGPFRNGLFNPSVMDEVASIIYQYNQTTGADGWATLTGTLTLTSHELLVSYLHDEDLNDIDRTVFNQGADLVYAFPQTLSQKAFSGTGSSEQDMVKMFDDCQGLSPFCVIGIRDDSVNVGQVSGEYQALSSIRVRNGTGRKVQADDDDNIPVNQFWLMVHSACGPSAGRFYGTNTLIYPFTRNCRSALIGANSGYYKFGGNETLNITSTVGGSDYISGTIWIYRAIRIKNNRVQDVIYLD